MRFHCSTQVNKDTTSQPVKQVHHAKWIIRTEFLWSTGGDVGFQSGWHSKFQREWVRHRLTSVAWLSANGGRLASGGCLPWQTKKRAKKWLFARWFQVPFLGWWIVTFSEVKWPRTGRWIGYFESPGVYCLNTRSMSSLLFFWGGEGSIRETHSWFE